MKKGIALLLVLGLPMVLFLLAACDGGGGGSKASVLFVDDDNGMNNHGDDVTDDPDVDQVYMEDLDALGIKYKLFRVMGPGSDGPDLTTLQKYDVVIWATGESYNGDSSDPLTLTLTDQANLADYLDGGGRLFLSSQDLCYDLNDTEDGDVLSAFANSYMGVLDATDGGAILPTTFGISGDPVSDGYVFTGVSYDGDYIDGFDTSDMIGSEAGSAVWDSSASPQTLTLAATSVTGFATTVFDSTYDIDDLTDDTLSFGSHSFWTYTNGDASPFDYWYESLGLNHVAVLDMEGGSSYFYSETDGVLYDQYPDSLNESNPFPANADTLLVDIDGLAVATRVEQDPWRVIFLALPYEGLGPDADRRDFLQSALDWLRE